MASHPEKIKEITEQLGQYSAIHFWNAETLSGLIAYLKSIDLNDIAQVSAVLKFFEARYRAFGTGSIVIVPEYMSQLINTFISHIPQETTLDFRSLAKQFLPGKNERIISALFRRIPDTSEFFDEALAVDDTFLFHILWISLPIGKDSHYLNRAIAERKPKVALFFVERKVMFDVKGFPFEHDPEGFFQFLGIDLKKKPKAWCSLVNQCQHEMALNWPAFQTYVNDNKWEPQYRSTHANSITREWVADAITENQFGALFSFIQDEKFPVQSSALFVFQTSSLLEAWKHDMDGRSYTLLGIAIHHYLAFFRAFQNYTDNNQAHAQTAEVWKKIIMALLNKTDMTAEIVNQTLQDDSSYALLRELGGNDHDEIFCRLIEKGANRDLIFGPNFWSHFNITNSINIGHNRPFRLAGYAVLHQITPRYTIGGYNMMFVSPARHVTEADRDELNRLCRLPVDANNERALAHHIVMILRKSYAQDPAGTSDWHQLCAALIAKYPAPTQQYFIWRQGQQERHTGDVSASEIELKDMSMAESSL